jgi:eukaryotic-like serine/threonine-protein kinase
VQPTTIAGRYRVERAVGRGGTGTVWLCRDEVLGRHVAVKQVGTMPGETTSDVHRALREARSSAALGHPHVVSVFDAVEDGDRNWLVMEYVASRTLAEVIAEDGPLSPERATWIGVQAADGLAAAHARGTMHRDVKPGNVLVTADDHVKITDFGIARTHGDPQLTSTGLIIGTPAYFSPETARGEEPSLKTDVWALGATLFAAVEGAPPYPDQGNPLALLTTIATRSAPLPRRAGDLTEAITRMMDRDPTTRWSMDDAAHALARLHDRHVGADRPQPDRTVALVAPDVVDAPAEHTPDRPRRRGRLLPVAIVLLLLALVGVVGALVLSDEDDSTPTAADPVSTAAPDDDSDQQPEPEPESAPETEPEPAPEPDPAQEPEPAEQDPPAGDVEAFGESYYALLPEDVESAYALLSSSYGSSLADYQAFWRTISAVAVRDVTAVDDTTVDVDLTYTSTDGAVEDETRRLFLEQTDEGLRIADDAAV